MPKFEVSQSVVINAPISAVKPKILDFKDWINWSPWLVAEPDCKLDYADDGSWYSWDGDIIGSGKMHHVSDDGEVIKLDLAFFKPWKSQADVEFRFAETSDGTKVTWSMKSALPFFMFFMKNKMVAWIGMDYQRGLAKLKDYVETGDVPSNVAFAGRVNHRGIRYVGISNSCDNEVIGEVMSKDFQSLKTWLADKEREGVEFFSIYHKWDMVNGKASYTAAVAMEEIPSELPAGFVSGTYNRSDAYKVVHTGAYRHLGNAWSAGMMHGQAKQFKQSKTQDPFEKYMNDPAVTAEKDLVTEVYFPCR